MPVKVHKDAHGYLRVYLSDPARALKPMMVHRLVLEAFVGSIPKGKQTNHKDGQKGNNCLSNLEAVTAKENTAHAFATGLKRVRYGEESQASKLTAGQVIEIRKLLKAGVPQAKIGVQYGVSQGTISFIYRGASWSTLEEESDIVRPIDRRGEHHPLSKLKEADVLEIREKLQAGHLSQSAIAREYGVTQAVISGIKTGRKWAWLQDVGPFQLRGEAAA